MAVSGDSALHEVAYNVPNPGQLASYCYLPASLKAGAPLVVVLHGCTQSAGGYDRGSGWSTMAERHGFALLYPEQRRANNPNLCFNWYAPEDARRDGGEAVSIREMVRAMIAAHDLDPARVYVTGLSAGGAMTAAMLATYPEVFAGGAIIAGLPFGCATSVPEAFDRMRGHGLAPAAETAARVRRASPHDGPWPSVSIWHGTADQTVAASNMEASIAQWCGVHGLSSAPSASDTVAAGTRRVWRDATGREAIEAYRIDGLAHGTPIDPRGPGGVGAAMPYMLDIGLSSTQRIAEFWGIADGRAVAATPHVRPAAARAGTKVPPTRRFAPQPAASGVAKVIEDALKAAGLMK